MSILLIMRGDLSPRRKCLFGFTLCVLLLKSTNRKCMGGRVGVGRLECMCECIFPGFLFLTNASDILRTKITHPHTVQSFCFPISIINVIQSCDNQCSVHRALIICVTFDIWPNSFFGGPVFCYCSWPVTSVCMSVGG